MKNFLIMLITVGTVVAGYTFYSQDKTASLPKLEASKDSITVSKPTPSEAPERVNAVEVHSADGSMKAVMQKSTKEVTSTYSIFISGPDIKNSLVYYRTLVTGSISIPPNSWSPDNKYFFIKENNGSMDDYLVFKATGENFADGAQYIDILPLYTNKIEGYSLRDVTGWDAPDLLHVFTNGPSYWFDLGSKSFLQLATK